MTIRGNAARRIPALKEAEFTRYLRAFESFTPDVNFCLGETAEIANLYVAAGFNSQGIIYGPGAGKALAEWISEGAPTFDASEVDVRRFATSQANERTSTSGPRRRSGACTRCTGPTSRRRRRATSAYRRCSIG